MALSRRAAFAMVATGMLITLVAVALARLSFGLILPAMRSALGLSYEQAGHLGTATALGYLALVMVAGALASRRGGRVSILLGLIFALAGFVALSLASNYYLILALMTVLGFATAFAYTPLISLMAGWFPQRRGLVIGLLNSGVGAGMMSAGWGVPYLSTSYASGWRWVWAAYAAVAAIALLAALLFLRNPPGRDGPALARSNAARATVFYNPYVVIVGIVYGIVGMTYIVQAIFMYSFSLEAGITPSTAGRIAALLGLIGIFAAPVWGSASDTLGRATSLMLALALACIATLIPVLQPTLVGFTLQYVILGMSVTGMFTSALAASTERVDMHQAPQAVSYVTVFFACGQLIGPTAAGALIGATGSFRTTFAISSFFLFVGVLLSGYLLRSRDLGRKNND